MQIKTVLERHDFTGVNRKVQLKYHQTGVSKKKLAETESEAEDVRKFFLYLSRHDPILGPWFHVQV